MPNFNNKPNFTINNEDISHWVSRSTAVIVTIILNNEKVLLVKRGHKISSSGKWCNPCGYLDWNENATECAIREVWEETGLDISDLIYNKKIKYNFLDYPWDIITNPSLNHNQDIALYFGVLIETEEIPLLTNNNCEEGEIEDAKWIDINSIDKYDIAFNHDKRIIKFINHMKNSP
jgi:8-oxo-dGTP pyrophosphatase MutT (NUDIX family)